MFYKRLEEVQTLLLKQEYFYGFLSFLISIKECNEIEDIGIVEDEILINKEFFLSIADETAVYLICDLIDQLFEYEVEYGPGDLMYAIPFVFSKLQEVNGISTDSTITDKTSLSSKKIGAGNIPAWADIYMSDLEQESKLDWKRILNEFIGEYSLDFSFSPPDKRFSDSLFFLPDFHEMDREIKKVLFMIDTSGSMSEESITTAYNEVKSAVEQFDNKLSGWLGFFDAEVVAPVEFSSIEELELIKAYGGGGTSFEAIFSHIDKHMSEDLPVSIVILTDGYAPFPSESKAMGIPVLWLITNSDVEPPWGRVARV